jgi:hypothetical protein
LVPKERTCRLLLPHPQLPIPSCGKNKQVLWAEWLRDEVVAEVATASAQQAVAK